MHRFRILHWIKILLEYYNKRKEILIEEVSLSPTREQFILSILYLFKVSDIERLKDILFNERDPLENETPHEFYKIVDYLRTEFAGYFRELILSRDFSDDEYVNLALEYLLLDEQVTKQIRIPLLDQLKKLTREGLYAIEEGKPFEEEKKILRLWKFFTALGLYERDRKEEILEEAYSLLQEKAKLIPSQRRELEKHHKIFLEELKSLLVENCQDRVSQA